MWQHRSLNGLAADLKADHRFLSERFQWLDTMLWLAVRLLFVISTLALKLGLLLWPGPCWLRYCLYSGRLTTHFSTVPLRKRRGAGLI